MNTTTGGSRADVASTERTRARRLHLLGYGLLAALAYVPILATKPGRVVADTKTYLYLDPGRLLERAVSMWDPNIGMGTVTHQNIGYLFPMGPYYWVLHLLGVPAWVSQRLWFGTILFAAALGMLFLLRTLRVRGPGVVVATVVFMLTPYTLDFAARISVILLPWAGLPWMLALVIRALHDDGKATDGNATDGKARDGWDGWRYPAIFAIVVQIVGGVNATALIFAGLAPVLWILYELATREVDWRRALRVTARIGVLTLLTSLWWIAGLWAQSGYGLNILKFTETLRVVSLSSLPSEVLRGLGYWFFYGIDRVGHWTEASVPYTQSLALLAVSFALPILALFAAGCIRWRHRTYFVVLTVVGVAVAVGANPYDDPSILGGLFKSFAESSSFGLALRSTSRAVPLVALGLAVLLGVGVNSASSAWAGRGRTFDGVPLRGLVLAGLIVALAIVNLPALWTGAFYTQDLTARRGDPAVLDRRHRCARRATARHTRPRDPRCGLCRVPVGSDGRSHHARSHGPTLRRPRAGAVGFGGVRRSAECTRSAAAGRRARPVIHRADRPAHERRFAGVPGRSPDRSFRPRAGGSPVAPAHRAGPVGPQLADRVREQPRSTARGRAGR